MGRIRGVFASFVVASLVWWAAPAFAAPAATTTAIAAANERTVFGQPVDFVATLSGGTTPTGSVDFDDGSTRLATIPLDGAGQATFTTGGLAVGSHRITATYRGDSGHGASHASLAHTVDKAASVTKVTVLSPASSGSFSSRIAVDAVPPGAGAPTGTVVYSENGSELASAMLGSDDSPSLPLSAGLHHVIATYSGDGHFLPSSADVINGVVGQGYRLVAADGGVFAFGSAPFFGSLGGTPLSAPIVAGVTTQDSRGYWMLGRDGGVFSFGSAPFLFRSDHGSTAMAGWHDGYAVSSSDGLDARGLSGGGFNVSADCVGGCPPSAVVGMASHGDGIWLATPDGGVFSQSGAPFFGSMGGVELQAPIVGMAATPSGNGYWLVASDGGVFSFGDAQFLGSTGALKLNQPVVGMAPTPTGNGYWLVASDGGVFSFGDARFLGSMGATRLNQPIVAVLPA